MTLCGSGNPELLVIPRSEATRNLLSAGSQQISRSARNDKYHFDLRVVLRASVVS